MNDRVFISYRRADTGATAGRLRDMLTERIPGQIFLDVEDIDPGQDFVNVIESALSRAAALVVVIGKHWRASEQSGAKLGDENDFVTLEIATAARMGVPIVPVLVDGAVMPGKDDLPRELHPMLRINAIEIRHPTFRRDVEPLATWVYGKLGLVPPTGLERFVESMTVKFAFGMRHFRFDERTRNVHAMLGLFFGALALLISVVLFAWSGGEPLNATISEALFLPFTGLYVGLIGKNSRKYRKLAWAGIAATVLSLIFDVLLVGMTIAR